MRTVDGVTKLERGEKAFRCVYHGAEICQGNKKSDGKPYSFSKHGFKLYLSNQQGQEYHKTCEAIFDANYKPEGVQDYQECWVVYSIGNDPTRLPLVVAFLPLKRVATPTPASAPAPAPTPVSAPAVAQVESVAPAPASVGQAIADELIPANDNDLPF